MATYRISGIWKDTNGIITHYAIHQLIDQVLGKATKYTKAQAVKLVETSGNRVATVLWNYSTRRWTTGEQVIVATKFGGGKFLKTSPDNQLKDNLAHLISMRVF